MLQYHKVFSIYEKTFLGFTLSCKCYCCWNLKAKMNFTKNFSNYFLLLLIFVLGRTNTYLKILWYNRQNYILTSKIFGCKCTDAIEYVQKLADI